MTQDKIGRERLRFGRAGIKQMIWIDASRRRRRVPAHQLERPKKE